MAYSTDAPMAHINADASSPQEVSVAPAAAAAAEDPDGGVVRDAALDREAEALLEELARSQQEVHLLMTQQREHATELGGMKEHLSTELTELQEEAWKLKVFTELEVLKKQLASLGNLEADIDRAEEYLDDLENGQASHGQATFTLEDEELDVDTSEEGMAAAVAAAAERRRRAAQGTAIQGLLGASPAEGSQGDLEAVHENEGGGVGEDGEEDVSVEEYEALQVQLDLELEQMYAQLQMVKSEAVAVAARKAELEEELLALLSAEAQSMEACLLEGSGEGQEGDLFDGGAAHSSDGDSQDEKFEGGAWGLGSGEDDEEVEGSANPEEPQEAPGTAAVAEAEAEESSSETAAGAPDEGLLAKLQGLAVQGSAA